MARITQVDYATATPEQRQAHDAEMALRGRMTNMKRTLLHSPVALRIYGEWFALRDQLLPILGVRPIWLFAEAISKSSDSPIGMGFMRRAIVTGGDDPDRLVLTAEEEALVALGQALGRNAQSVPDAIWGQVAERYDEKTLVDLIAFAGLMVATNLFTDAVKTEMDTELLPFLGARAE
ncbi:hypothetical protein PSQ90_06565 [Devosia rhodophyticola]|uniref:Carboxymuconolactone decarboxylase family protein n=1 Tax=Devosia rhodophyticola TaxID=3026423 RepID=A0ABY7Z116_9HYPH|nr:hypothetical protein [Devosia rhodophyticola]WDR07092.1 hypothetical protein PSQ90_06565 [Devosia rhodophyticola]